MLTTVYRRLALPPDEFSLSLLPLFTSEETSGITGENLHPGFYPFNVIEDLSLPIHTVNMFKIVMGIESIGEVLLTPGINFLAQRNFGEKSLAKLRATVRSICLNRTLSVNSEINLIFATVIVDFTSYENVVSNLIEQRVRSGRDQEMFKRRLLFERGKCPTFVELGRDFGISSNRVQQIWMKYDREFRRKVNLEKLAYFIARFEYCVAQYGGGISLNALPSLLQSEFKWPNAPYAPALEQFLLYCCQMKDFLLSKQLR